jgi:hypothetical protein
MFKRVVGGVMWLGRITVFIVGLAVVTALVVDAAGPVMEKNGKPLILGITKNTATNVTQLVGKVATGAAFRVSNPSGGTALELVVDAAVPPMSVNSTTVVSNLNADLLDGKSAADFLGTNVIKRESAVEAGTDKGDGTFVISQSCNAGEQLLSGGPANVNAASWMVESFPTPGSTNSWTARINKNGAADNFSVVVLCAS